MFQKFKKLTVLVIFLAISISVFRTYQISDTIQGEFVRICKDTTTKPEHLARCMASYTVQLANFDTALTVTLIILIISLSGLIATAVYEKSHS